MSSEALTLNGPIDPSRTARKFAVLIINASVLALGVAVIILPRT